MPQPDLHEPAQDTEVRMRWIRALLQALDEHATRFGLSPEQASQVFMTVAVTNARTRGLSESIIEQTLNEAMSHFRDMVH